MKMLNSRSQCLWAVFIGFAITGCGANQKPTIIIGSKNFTESLILTEILAQSIEQKTDIIVDRRLNLGGTFVCHKALVAGQLDAYVEYTGTAFTAIMKEDPITNPKTVYQKVKEYYSKNLQLEWMKPLGFNNTFAMTIRGEDAQKFNIKTISQAAKYTPQWQAGFGPEFLERKDGYEGLVKTYNLKFREEPKTMDLGLIHLALKEKQVDFIAAAVTDGLIDSFGLVVLEDDKQYFPPYEAAPIVRQATLAKYPQLQQVINDLGGQISEVDMRKMNYQVDGEKKDIKEVAQSFLANLATRKKKN